MSQVLGDLRDNRGRTSARAAAHASSHEHHIRPIDRVLQPRPVFHRRSTPDVRVRTRAEPLGDFGADLHRDRRVEFAKRLQVRIGRDELNAGYRPRHHVFDGVAAAATNADHLDHRCSRRRFNQLK